MWWARVTYSCILDCAVIYHYRMYIELGARVSGGISFNRSVVHHALYLTYLCCFHRHVL